MTLGQFLICAGALLIVVFIISGVKTYKEEKAKQNASAKIKQKAEEKEDEE